jgi:hypothetical protein
VPNRLITTAGLVLALACLSAPLALADAGGPPPLNGAGYDGRSPDTKDAAAVAHHNQRTIANTKLATTAGPSMNGVGYDGRSPDTKDAAAAAHRSQRGISTAKAVVTTAKASTAAGPPLNGAGYDGRSPDTKDAAWSVHYTARTISTAKVLTTARAPRNGASYDGRSPDTKDAASAARQLLSPTVVVASSTGFDWTDAGIGALAGFGLAVVLAAGFSLLRRPARVAIPS